MPVTKKLSRRDFIKFAGLVTASGLVAACAPDATTPAPLFEQSAQPDIFIIAGQSNASGRGTNNQVVRGAMSAYVLGNDFTLKLMADPIDSNVDQVDSVSMEPVAPPAGSVWPLVATSMMASTNRSCIFVPCALGGSKIAHWQPGMLNHANRRTLYGSMIYRAREAVKYGGTLRAVLWWQGESDTDLSKPEYNTALDSLANAIMADLGIPLMPCKLQDCGDKDETNVNEAIGEAWVDNSNVLPGPDLHDILADDNVWNGITYHVHICSDEKLKQVADLWWMAIKDAYSW